MPPSEPPEAPCAFSFEVSYPESALSSREKTVFCHEDLCCRNRVDNAVTWLEATNRIQIEYRRTQLQSMVTLS